MTDHRELFEEYKKKKKQIKKRLKEFEKASGRGARDIFSELCFCILTPQSNARHCDKAIQELKERGILFTGTSRAIRPVLRGRARFHNKKADYIVGARTCFKPAHLKGKDVLEIRDLLVKNIKGLGYKEASHFLRNIGLGENIAILDRHILKNLKRYGAIKNISSSMTEKTYLDVEEKMRHFAKKIKIPLEELDLLFWSMETGEIFK